MDRKAGRRVVARSLTRQDVHEHRPPLISEMHRTILHTLLANFCRPKHHIVYFDVDVEMQRPHNFWVMGVIHVRTSKCHHLAPTVGASLE